MDHRITYLLSRLHRAGITAACASVILGATRAPAATFRVTSDDLTGPGSFLKAVEMANKMQGTDTIQFDPGLRIDLTSDDEAFRRGVVHLTESAIIDGAGSTVFSRPAWVGTGGEVNNDSTIHNPKTIIVRPAMRFLQIGNYGEDNTGIAVTVRNLNCEKLNNFAIGERNASLTVENVSMRGLRAITPQRDGFISGSFENLTIRDTIVSESNTFDQAIYVDDSYSVFAGGIQGSGNLVMENVTMQDNFSAGAVLWTSGPATIVSSRFLYAGGVQVFSGNATIVNSAFDFGTGGDEGEYAVSVGPGGRIDLIASTVYTIFHGSPPDDNGRPLRARGGSINLIGSAVYGGAAGPEFGPFPGFAYYATAEGTFSADDYSWVSVVDDQDEGTLRMLFQNPNLLTDEPGLGREFISYPQSITPVLGTTNMPGVLIDAIPDAGPGGQNELLNPVTGQPILVDVLGNPRVDGNGSRDIGAVQLNLAPHLQVAAVGNTTATLSWNRPADVPTDPFTGYRVFYREVGRANWWQVPVPNPEITGFTVSGLTNGVAYEFEVAGVTSAAEGPHSNTVQVTPYGPVLAPVPVATPGVQQVGLIWEIPDAGGYTISGYGVYYRLVGAESWTYFGETTDTSMTVAGLQQGTAYEFGVKTLTTVGVLSAQLGITTATTLADPLAILEELMENLCGQGILNHGQCHSLTVKLVNAGRALARGQAAVADKNLAAFQHELDAFLRGRILTDQEAHPLWDAAQQLRTSLR